MTTAEKQTTSIATATAEDVFVRGRSLCREHIGARAHGSRQYDGAGIDFPDLLDQGKGTEHTSMPARSGAHRDDAIDALRRGLLRVPQVDDVVKHDAAIAMHGGHHFGGRP